MSEDKIIATNRQASHNYTILERLAAGIEQKGTEVKSLTTGQVNLKERFARVEGAQVFLYNMHIAPYEFGNIHNVDPIRPRRLLLHKNQIRRLAGELSAKRLTLIPLKLYFKKGIAKVELGLAKAKKLYDKRESIRQRDAERDLRRAIKGKR